MFKGVKDVFILLLWGCIWILFLYGLFIFGLLAEAAVRDHTHLGSDDTIDHELMRVGGMRILDHFGSLFIDVFIVASVIFNCFLGVD